MPKPGNITKVEVDLCAMSLSEIQGMHRQALQTKGPQHFTFTGKSANSGAFELYISIHEGMMNVAVFPAGGKNVVGDCVINVEDLGSSEADFVRMSCEKGEPGGGHPRLVDGIRDALAEAHIEVSGPHKDIIIGKLIALLRESVLPTHELFGSGPEDHEPVFH